VSELEICCSAKPSISHGTQISTTANSASGFQRGSRARTWPRARATGSSRTAAIAVRASTIVLGETSSTATLMSR
jgi:hypothetical protein